MEANKRIKNYTYNERHCLGEGSFGKVYQGKSREGLIVAIKKVDKNIINESPYLRNSLQTEISIMKKLSHPNIVKLYDVVLTHKSIYFVMEYCLGGDLKNYLRNKKINEEEAIKIIKQICKGFQQIVKAGIIHRDLKPPNILIHEGVFKICDFGCSKLFSDGSRMAKTCVGTPIYMSPQALSQKPYTDKTDVWSLGILLYQILFGKLPYFGITGDAIYKSIIQGPLNIPNCSNFALNLIRGMLQIDESKRYSWKKIFEMFSLEPLPEQKNQTSDFTFFKPIDLKKQQSNNQRQQYESNFKINNKNSFIDVNNFRFFEEKRDKKNSAPTPLLKNALGFQNSPMIMINNFTPTFQNRNRTLPLQQKKDRPTISELKQPTQMLKQASFSQQSLVENPRYLYFLLMELIENPINSSQYYELVSSTYRKAILLYPKKIEEEKLNSSLTVRILQRQFELLKSMQSQIPNYLNSDMQKSPLAIYKQGTESGNEVLSLAWVRKIVTRMG